MFDLELENRLRMQSVNTFIDRIYIMMIQFINRIYIRIYISAGLSAFSVLLIHRFRQLWGTSATYSCVILMVTSYLTLLTLLQNEWSN